jgi:hypothetical protein
VNAEDEAKTGPLVSLPGAAERLKLFQADLSEEGAFDSAVEGCEGVFDVASPMDFTKLSEVLIMHKFILTSDLLRDLTKYKFIHI